MFSKIKQDILDTVFPIFCVGCKKEGSWLCLDCSGLVTLADKQFCPVCGKISGSGKVCERCADKSALESVISCGYYHNPVLRACIGALKYDNAREIIPKVEKTVTAFFEKYGYLKNIFSENPVIVPVPLHRKRLWERGFNQAEIIARILAEMFNLQIGTNILKRKIYTGEQAKIKIPERGDNVKNAFTLTRGTLDKGCQWSPLSTLAGKKVILVDDVYTTGSTMQECAKILRAGVDVDKVYGFALARG